MLRKSILGFGLAMASLIGIGQASGGPVSIATDRFGYSGSMTQYATLADAQAGTNPLGTFAVGSRDFSIYFNDNAPGVDPQNDFVAQTAWYYTTTGPNPGDGNPSNQNEGFVQINDPDHASVTGFSAAFTDLARTAYHLQVSGANADYANQLARLGPQGSNAYGGDSTTGTFLTYKLDATFSNLNPADFDPTVGAYTSYGDPPSVAVSGTFTGIFQNQGNVPAFNGFYAFDFNLDTTSWAYDHRDQLMDTENPFRDSYYASNDVAAVPEPGSIMLMLVGLGGIVIVGAGTWRKDRNQAVSP